MIRHLYKAKCTNELDIFWCDESKYDGTSFVISRTNFLPKPRRVHENEFVRTQICK